MKYILSKRKVFFFIRLIFGLSLIIFLLSKVSWDEFSVVIANIDLFYIIPLFAISFLMITISCLKWKMLLAVRGIDVSITRLISLYLVGYFFNNFMLGQYGGDLARSYILGGCIKNYVESFASVFMEKFTGLSALIGMTFLASAINFALLKQARLLWPLTLVVIAYLIFLLLMFNQGISNKIKGMTVPGYIMKMGEKLINLHSVIFSFKGQKPIIAKALIISLVFHAMTIVNTVVVCLALGISAKILDVALIVPIVLLVSMIPISINSIGIQEGAFVYLFSLVGISLPAALSIALVLRAKNLIVALIGGAIFATRSKIPAEVHPS